jgi:hypothetical protein
MEQLLNGLQTSNNHDSVFARLSTLNMLNTRYLIYDPNSAPLINKRAFGNAWFVDETNIVQNADAEIAALNNFNPLKTAIIDRRFEDIIKGKSFNKDENGSVKLIESKPNYLRYSTKASGEQLAVFSEVYYDKGWNAYIDGKKTGHIRANYILRAIPVPAGEHIIEFRFEPNSYYKGNTVTMASSILLILALAGYIFMEYRNRKNK